MDPRVNRRRFLAASATAAAGLGLDWTSAGVGAQGNSAVPATTPPTFKTTLQKAAMVGGQPTEERLREIKAAGFDGLEYSANNNTPLTQEQALELRKLIEKTGLRVHSVLRGWAAFNSTVPEQVQTSFVACENALRTAQWLGADAVLIVTCQIPVPAFNPGGGGRGRGGGTRGAGAAATTETGRAGGAAPAPPAPSGAATTTAAAGTAQAPARRGGGGGLGAPTPFRMPDPWEFQIEFDQKTGLVSKVVYGDNAPYAEYIKLHNHAIQTSAEWTRKLIPLAEKTKVVIAIENVWNNLWVEPKIFRHFVASFNSPWVKAYYDIGNNIKWAPPEEWVLTLGGLLSKIHVKDFLLDPASPTGNGRFVAIRDGSTRWPILRAALDRVNYNGWITIEAPMLPTLEEQAKRLDMFMAGL
jgi:hexulose-6-phosphate isomerase